jgi:hypothetical protein
LIELAFTAALPGNVLLLSADRIENRLSIAEVVYRAVACQRVDEIRYNTVEAKISLLRNSLNTQGFSSVWLPVHGMTYYKKCFRLIITDPFSLEHIFFTS